MLDSQKGGCVSLSQPVSSRSPWAGAVDEELVEITPVTKPVHGSLQIPGSKSYTNRALLIAALARGESILNGILKSDDSYWCLDALKKLGITTEIKDDQVRLEGCAGRWKNRNGELFIGSAGTIARFLPGALAVSPEGSWLVDGTDQLRNRPLEPLIQALRELGAEIEYVTDHRGLPLKVSGQTLKGGQVQIAGNVSSQFLSGLLMASSYAQGPVNIRVTNGLVQPSYIEITLQLMEQFGAKVERFGQMEAFTVYPTGYAGRRLTLEADASTACYFLSLAALTGGTIRITNVGYHSAQPDAKFIDVLEKMGCRCEKGEHFLQVTGPEKLRGGFAVDMKPMSDQAITLAALAPFADGPIRVYNVPHIRKHESDRIAVICEALKRLGANVQEFADGFEIRPGNRLQGTLLDPHDDHRQAMVFALLGTKIPGVRISDPGCVSKTCPTFFSILASLGVQVQFR